jgi:SAM-dependent methyltransferase
MPSDDVQDIRDYYDRGTEVEEERLNRHQLEYDLTWRYLEEYLPAGGSVLEIGAATGRYTVELARRGHIVTAVDLSAACLAYCRRRLVAADLADMVTLVQADARDLSGVPHTLFSAALIMGPLYHLVELEDRRQALREVHSRLPSGSVVVSAHISLLGILGDLMRKQPEWIERRREVRSVMHRGRDSEEYPRGLFRGFFTRVEEVRPLHEGAGFETIALAAVEPCISADYEPYNAMTGERRRLWLDLLYEVSREPSLIGGSRHLLYIGRKR